MFIVWGTKEIRKKPGNCAYFCAVCHDIRVHKVEEIYTVGHLYYLPLGRKKFASTEVVCGQCQNIRAFTYTAENFYCSKDKELSVLKERVPTGLLEEWQQNRQRHIETLENPGLLSKDERAEKIQQAFVSFENKLVISVEKGPTIDKSAAPGCLAFIALILIMIFCGEAIMDSSLGKSFTAEYGIDGFGVGMLLVLFAGGAQIVWLFATNRSRFFKRHIYPQLAANLAPLKPTFQELLSAKEFLKENRYEMRRFKINKLQMAISESRLR